MLVEIFTHLDRYLDWFYAKFKSANYGNELKNEISNARTVAEKLITAARKVILRQKEEAGGILLELKKSLNRLWSWKPAQERSLVDKFMMR